MVLGCPPIRTPLVARLPRYFVPGVPLHLIERGNNRQVIFFDEGQRGQAWQHSTRTCYRIRMAETAETRVRRCAGPSTSRGDPRESIYDDDEDRVALVVILSRVVGDFTSVCHA
jgi:hypothetical protein